MAPLVGGEPVHCRDIVLSAFRRDGERWLLASDANLPGIRYREFFAPAASLLDHLRGFFVRRRHVSIVKITLLDQIV